MFKYVQILTQIKKHAATLLEVDTAVEEEARARADIEDQCGIADRKGMLHCVVHNKGKRK